MEKTRQINQREEGKVEQLIELMDPQGREQNVRKKSTLKKTFQVTIYCTTHNVRK
jgi:uncharacterized protein Veg